MLRRLACVVVVMSASRPNAVRFERLIDVLPPPSDTLQTRSNRCLKVSGDRPSVRQSIAAADLHRTSGGEGMAKDDGVRPTPARAARAATAHGARGPRAPVRRGRSRRGHRGRGGPDPPRRPGGRRRPDPPPAPSARGDPRLGRAPRLPAEHARDRRGGRPDQPEQRRPPADDARAQGLPAPRPEPAAGDRGHPARRRRHGDAPAVGRRRDRQRRRAPRAVLRARGRPDRRRRPDPRRAGRSRTSSRSPASSSATASCSCSRSSATR